MKVAVTGAAGFLGTNLATSWWIAVVRLPPSIGFARISRARRPCGLCHPTEMVTYQARYRLPPVGLEPTLCDFKNGQTLSPHRCRQPRTGLRECRHDLRPRPQPDDLRRRTRLADCPCTRTACFLEERHRGTRQHHLHLVGDAGTPRRGADGLEPRPTDLSPYSRERDSGTGQIESLRDRRIHRYPQPFSVRSVSFFVGAAYGASENRS